MAIIYETKTDYEREKLKDQSNNTYMQAASQGATGMASVIVGSLIHDFNNKDSGAMRLMGNVANIFGIIKVVQSFMTGNKAHNLKLERDRLGPQNIVYPPDVPLAADMPVAGSNVEKACCAGSKCHNVKPTTLLEQAEKHLSTLGRE